MIRTFFAYAGTALFIAGSAIATAQATGNEAGVKADLAKGKQVAGQICVACHGVDGNSTAPANPKLAGQIPEYLQKQLMNFKPNGAKPAERDNAIMKGMVAALSESDTKNVAAFYASQTLKPALARDKDLAARGQKLFRGGNMTSGVPACAGCHGPNGAGNSVQYPRIAGQYAEYIDAQLRAFRAGARANDMNGMMRGVAARMTDQEIKAVAEYTAGLR
ncbi:MAG: cytochrome c4 [Betaproteobacteria bacterium]|nr:cytochrome c4 [Betaproteobacteria bacterium]